MHPLLRFPACMILRKHSKERVLFILLLLLILQEGCYVNKNIGGQPVFLEEDVDLFSYEQADGTRIKVRSEGLTYQGTSAAGDSLIFVPRHARNEDSGVLISTQSIPVSGIKSIQYVPESETKEYGSFGMGHGSGFTMSGGFTVIPYRAGLSGQIRMLWYGADLPEDYTGLFHFNNLYMFSCTGIAGKNFGEKQKLWLGVELGPSWVEKRVEYEEYNPNYDPNDSDGSIIDRIINSDKYFRDNLKSHSPGLSLGIRMSHAAREQPRWQFGVSGNINSCKTIMCADVSLMFGKR